MAVLTVFCLMLSGCAALLDQDYVDVTPYEAVLTTEGDPSTLRAESYQELVNALMHFVTTGAETGRIRLYMASEELESELDAACLEVVQEDPLGAYAVDYIKYSVSPVVTYSEAEVQIFYRRSREQVDSITSVTGTTAIRSAFESLLSSFETQKVLRISYFDGNESFIRNLFRQTYYSAPLSAVELPTIDISIYPKAGRQRIVELTLNYHLDTPQLEARRADLARQLDQLCQTIPAESSSASELAQVLLSACRYDPDGGATAYHAFTEGTANREGMALAFAALCEKQDVPCLVVRGTLQNSTHFWNLVRHDYEWYHVDLTAYLPEGSAPLLLTDAEMAAGDYVWVANSYPQSGTESLLPPVEEPEAPPSEALSDAE